jgi:hypothetical protein
VGVATLVVGGVQSVVVSRPDSLWVWPTSNTGAFVSSVGTCCANSTVGACCWTNGAAVASPPTNVRFRGLALSPSPSTCTSPGYYCATGTTVS